MSQGELPIPSQPNVQQTSAPQGERGDPATEDQAAAALRQRIASQFGRSLHIRTLDTGSCAACEQEIRLLAAPHYDLHRLGFFFTPAPRHADLLMVTGPMIRAFDIAARKTYDAMPGPKVVVAVDRLAEKVPELSFASDSASGKESG